MSLAVLCFFVGSIQCVVQRGLEKNTRLLLRDGTLVVVGPFVRSFVRLFVVWPFLFCCCLVVAGRPFVVLVFGGAAGSDSRYFFRR